MPTTPRIIVVGGGLAGLSAVIKIAESVPFVASLSFNNPPQPGVVR